MVTINYITKGSKDKTTVYVRFYQNKKEVCKKTGFTVISKDWNAKTQLLNNDNLEEDKTEQNNKLNNLKQFLKNAFEDGEKKGVDFNAQWLEGQIKSFHDLKPIVDMDILTNCIQRYIDEAPFKTKDNGQIGLSTGRITNFKKFKGRIKTYEQDVFSGRNILINEIDAQFVENYKIWLLSKGNAINTVGDNIKYLKTICIYASGHKININPQILRVKSVSEKKKKEDIVWLTEAEQKTICELKLEREALINARKFLIIGLSIGQRGSDVLNITSKNIVNREGLITVDLVQSKTGALVSVPLNDMALEIIKDGLPYKISMQHFNEYIKDICRLAGFNELINGKKRLEKNSVSIKDTYFKWELCSSHIMRRSFCSQYYGRISTPLLMQMSSHTTEKSLRVYIGAPDYDAAKEMKKEMDRLKAEARKKAEELKEKNATMKIAE